MAETPKNLRFANMTPVASGSAKTFRKCIRSVVQVCNGKEIQLRTPGYTSNFSGEFFPSGVWRNKGMHFLVQVASRKKCIFSSQA